MEITKNCWTKNKGCGIMINLNGEKHYVKRERERENKRPLNTSLDKKNYPGGFSATVKECLWNIIASIQQSVFVAKIMR